MMKHPIKSYDKTKQIITIESIKSLLNGGGG